MRKIITLSALLFASTLMVIAINGKLADRSGISVTETQNGLPPTGVTPVNVGNGSVNLSWTPPLDLTNFTHYNVYRSEQSGFVPGTVNRIAENVPASSYADLTTLDFRTYYYVVSANYNNSGTLSEAFSEQSTGILVNNTSQTTIIGYAFLEARFNHANIKVNFVPVSPSAVADSVYTNALGYYEINDLIPGVYHIRLSRPGFQTPLIYENRTIIADMNLGSATLYDLGTAVSGNVEGNWSGFYSVTGDITVPSGDSLVISAGTVIRFLGNFNLHVYGYLAVNGALGDSVIFTSGPANQVQAVNQWQRIRFYDASNDNSYLKYARIEYANDGVYCEWSGPKVENSMIRRNGRYGIYFADSYGSIIKNSEIRNSNDDGMHLQRSYVTVENCIISNYGNEGVYMNNYSKLTISSSQVSNGPTGIYLINSSDLMADGCTFSNNTSQGVYFQSNWSRGYIANSSFTGNTKGIYLYYETHPKIINNLFSQNTNGIEYFYDCDALVEGNEFSNNQYGIVFNTSSHYCQTIITKNLIVQNTVDGIHKNSYNWASAATNPTITYNTISNNGRHGIYNDRQGVEVITNNIISNNGGWGILTNIAVETFENNNVFGNTSGAINNLTHFPAATWNFISVNPNNNATCDIYRNINEDPMFTGTGSQVFSLQAGSKCINGGAVGVKDPDGSISDIGVFPFDLGNPHQVSVTGTGNQSVSLTWTPVANDSLVSYKVFFKESAQTNYSLFGSSAGTSATVTGLTNNVLYDFSVKGVYPAYESPLSPKASSKPGVTTLEYDPGSFSVVIPTGQPSKTENFMVTNTGSRDLSINFAEGNPNPGYLYLDGNGDFVSYGHHNHLHGMSALTMECWIYRQNSGHFEFFGKNYRNYQLAINSSQRVHFYKGYGTIGSNSNQEWNTNVAINANQWNHIALTWTGKSIKLYVNGTFVWETTNADPRPIPDFHLYAFEFGRRAGENAYYMQGRLAEARLWNVVRTQDEIRENMYNSLVGNETGLIGYWPLQKDFKDYSQYGINGTAYGEAQLQTGSNLPFSLFSVPQTSYAVAPGQTQVVPITFINRTDMTSRFFTTKLFSDDPLKSVSNLEMFVQYGETVPASPVYFSPVAPTGKPYTIVIKDAKIDGQPIAIGDEIAAFDGDLCVGAGIFNGTYNFVFTAWESDLNQSLPGYTPGNPMTFRLYDTLADLETNEATETYFIGNDTFGYGTFSALALQASVFNFQPVAVTGGQFNLVSFNLFPRYPNAWTVFGGMSGLQIVYNDEGQVLIPGYNINTIGDINFLDGFYLYTSQAQTIQFEGTFIRPQDWSITLKPSQWNYISMLSRNPVAVTDVFAGVQSSISIVQDASGLSWIPSESINTIGNMQPGKGYKVALSSGLQVVFSYPAPGSKSADLPETLAKHDLQGKATTYFQYTQTGLPYTAIVTIKSPQDSPYNLQPGDEIGLFVGNLCVGAAVFTGNPKLIITAWQKDESQNLPGFTSGNPIEARIYRQSQGSTTKHTLKNFSGGKTFFGESNYTKGVLEVIPINDEAADMYVSPNPFKSETTITVDLKRDELLKVNIFDNTGRLVRSFAKEILAPATYRYNWNGADFSGRTLKPGVYFIIAETADTVITEKVIILQ